MSDEDHGQTEYGWRSSRILIISTACLALFTETLLYGFVVPILPYMLEVRLHIDPSQTQSITSALLSVHGFATLILTPLIAAAADKTPNRKIPLIISLVVCLGGTVLVAFTPTLWAIYLGRILQGVSGSAAWIICLAMLTDNAGPGRVGRVMGLSMSVVMTGTVAGPTVAGALLEWMGYWPAWSVPIGIILINIAGRLITEEPQKPPPSPPRTEEDVENAETSPLLSGSDSECSAETFSQDKDTCLPAPSSFYWVMLRDCRVLASISTTTVNSIIIAGFNATLPVHLRAIFNWGSFTVGMMFLLIRIPTIVFGPFMGMLRDHVGLRYPTALGWLLLTPLIFCLGIPSGPEHHGKEFFVTCIACIGLGSTLIQGAGVLHTITILRDVELKQPQIFGRQGGLSRVFAINEVSFNAGLMFGPLLAGGLTEAIGYSYMNIILAVICFANAVFVFYFFEKGISQSEK
ncbi:hypothetical protein N7532_000800 [Penicillium argentinense]|uniref:Major facilitator superfamily (MFS) profile domain-containing protein n=1 Tax=Penicillium argentinense TaxID=1131581 RepID=A0A9W9KNN4_9EURO|nr:uncharacterized protein N7532_000800 [Penicillium argentinense]KAJ5112755.1 hypothetical protein N7532_000800 [Penicillium argentinense]